MITSWKFVKPADESFDEIHKWGIKVFFIESLSHRHPSTEIDVFSHFLRFDLQNPTHRQRYCFHIAYPGTLEILLRLSLSSRLDKYYN